MRTSGMIEYITPRQIATESSTTPKSVMKTIVCGYFPLCAPANVENISRNASNKNFSSELRFPSITCDRAVLLPMSRVLLLRVECVGQPEYSDYYAHINHGGFESWPQVPGPTQVD